MKQRFNWLKDAYQSCSLPQLETIAPKWREQRVSMWGVKWGVVWSPKWHLSWVQTSTFETEELPLQLRLTKSCVKLFGYTIRHEGGVNIQSLFSFIRNHSDILNLLIWIQQRECNMSELILRIAPGLATAEALSPVFTLSHTAISTFNRSLRKCLVDCSDFFESLLVLRLSWYIWSFKFWIKPKKGSALCLLL